jgi:hypothetical protein
MPDADNEKKVLRDTINVLSQQLGNLMAENAYLKALVASEKAKTPQGEPQKEEADD